MPEPDFFSRLGLFVVQDFFSLDFCAALRRQARAVAHCPATVVGQDERLDETIRSTRRAQIAPETVSLLHSRLVTIKPQLEQHFKVRLTGCEKPQLLVYRESDFFVAHRDSSDYPDAPQDMRERKISIVVFLNAPSDEAVPESYSGGSLTLYGLVDAPEWQKYGFSLAPEPGLLIAFPSKIFHEVTRVTRGERYTVVSWFVDSPSDVS